MTKLAENSGPKVISPKKGKWPLVIGAWALVEGIASGWGIGAAFLAHQASTALPDEKKLAILRDPEQVGRLSSFQANQLLSSGQFTYLTSLIPFILYLVIIGIIKLFFSTYLLKIADHSFLSEIIKKLCSYSRIQECPEFLSIPYTLINILFSIIILLLAVRITEKIVLHNVKSHLFGYTYNKWGAVFFVGFTISVFGVLFVYFFQDLIGFILKMVNPETLNFNKYLQFSLSLVIIPSVIYIIYVYVLSGLIFIKFLKNIRSYKSKAEKIEIFNNAISASNLTQMRQALQKVYRADQKI